MAEQAIPEKLRNLHAEEEQLRRKATVLVEGDNLLALHLSVIEHAMDLADILRQFPTDEEDMKVVQLLGMRIFNAFGASVKLALSGYVQNSALIMRDILETVFLMNLFRGDRTAIERWRLADEKERIKISHQFVCARLWMPATDSPVRNAQSYMSCFLSLPAILR